MLRVQILRANLLSSIESSVLRRRTRRSRISLTRQLLCSVSLFLSACIGCDPARASTDSVPDAFASLTFRRCHLKEQSSVRIEQEVMEADTIDGVVSWDTHDDFIHDCWFTGGLGIAIGLSSRPTGTIAGNRIEGYDTGINVTDADVLVIEQNSIVRCATGIAL